MTHMYLAFDYVLFFKSFEVSITEISAARFIKTSDSKTKTESAWVNSRISFQIQYFI